MPGTTLPARTIGLAGAAVAALLAMLLVRVPGQGQWLADVGNAAHGPAFMIVTLAVLSLLAARSRQTLPLSVEYLLAIAAAMLLGALVELVQHFTGRDAELSDLWRDALGSVAGAGLFLVLDPRVSRSPRRPLLRGAGTLIALAAGALMAAPLVLTASAYAQRDRGFPALADFSSPVSDYFVRARGAVSVSREKLPALAIGDAERMEGLRVQIQEKRSYWGVFLLEPHSDWRGYRQLVLDLVNPTDSPLVLRVLVRDRDQVRIRGGGYRAFLEIPAGERARAAVPIGDMTSAEGIQRVDAASIRSVTLGKGPRNRAMEFYVLRIWLE